MNCASILILLLNGAPLTDMQAKALPRIQAVCWGQYGGCVKQIEVKDGNHLSVTCKKLDKYKQELRSSEDTQYRGLK